MSSANHCQPARVQGFTLLEILVVVVIIGVMTSVFLISLQTDRHDQVKEEAQRLAALLRLASQESLLGSKIIAVEVFVDGYRFLISDQDQWHEVEDRLLSPHQLPDGLTLDIELEGAAATSANATADDVPRIYLYPTGEKTPFIINVSAAEGDVRYSVSSGINGKLEYALQQ